MPKANNRSPIDASAKQPPLLVESESTLPASYEAAVDELEQLMAQLEAGDVPLERLLLGYQRGTVLLQFCRQKLQAVEEQVKLLDANTLEAQTWKQQ